MAESASFTPEIFTFLRQLKRNNDREWFARNKARYQQSVVDPALSFITAFAFPLEKISPYFVADARPTRGSLFRIYRDTRFAADKRPFKTHVGIHFSHANGKDIHAPVFYLHLEPDHCFAAAGIWHPDNRTLVKLRTAIVAHADQWGKIRKAVKLEGDRLSRPPRGFDRNHPFIEDLKLKDLVASLPLAEKQVCGKQFTRDFARICGTMSSLVEFTTKALGLKF